MTSVPITAVQPSTKQYFEFFQAAFNKHRFEAAAEAFDQALDCDPGNAFRYFVSRASGNFSQAVNRSGFKAQILQRLDALIEEHPYLHYLADPEDVKRLERVIAIREGNIEKGLPSILIALQGKSASASVSAIFNSGFRLPSVCYSLVTQDVIDKWALDYARGGACYGTHLAPSAEKVAKLKRAGINRMIVHVRDPRQILISFVHHLDRYQDQAADWRSRAQPGTTVGERARLLLGYYKGAVGWITGWVELEKEIDIMFSTHEQFVADKDAFVERYLEFYGADRAHFSRENALTQHAGLDYHFRSGRTDEWRDVLDPEFAEQLSTMLPAALKARFGWSEQ